MFRLAGNSGRKPSSEVEKTLAGLWENLLKLEAGSIGMDSQFFRMGGFYRCNPIGYYSAV